MKKIKLIDKNYFIILIISLLIMIPLFNKLYIRWGHDTGYHIANILAISENLNFHNLFNLKIFPLIANNFGYGSGIFYPQLSHIIAALFYKLFNISVFTSIKITNFIIILLSGIFMYRFMKVVTNNQKLSFISTLFYMTAPYKLYDIFIRDAMSESLVFVFLPLILLSIHYLLNKKYKRFYINFIIGYVGLINSHLVMTVYVTIFLSIILIINWKKFWNKENVIRFILATIIVLLICLPFIIPLLTHKFNGDYVVFQDEAMANSFGVYGNGLNIHQYFIGWRANIGYHFINYVALGLIIYLFVKLIKEKKLKQKIKEDYLFATGFICTILGIWMSSLLFPWMLMPSILLMIQFPWRLGTFTTIGVSILVFYAIKNLNKNQNRFVIASIISCLCIAAFCIFTQKYVTADLNNYNLSHEGMGWQYEYLPVKANENRDYLNERSNDVIVTDGKAHVEIINDKTPYLKFEVTEVENEIVLELPRLYYLGYEIKANYGDYEEILNYQENKNGFIEIKLEKDAIIEMDYKGTKLAKIGNIVSLLTITIFGIIIIVKRGE